MLGRLGELVVDLTLKPRRVRRGQGGGSVEADALGDSAQIPVALEILAVPPVRLDADAPELIELALGARDSAMARMRRLLGTRSGWTMP